MPARTRPYEQFGPFVLLRKLESDALGDLWRAARIENNALGPVVALRRLSGGDRAALSDSVRAVHQLLPSLNGPSFVRGQSAEIINEIPCLSYEYAGGRSLRHIVNRARGGNGVSPQPVPLDQAIIIAEKVALSIATTAELRFGGERLTHGALIPQFVWIGEDGEIRVGGQQLGPGLIASLRDEKVSAEIGRYFSTEYQHSGRASKDSEVYALGAVLYLVVTGHEPPDATRVSAFTQAIRGAKAMDGSPIPEELRAVIEKSLNLDPAARFASVADMKQALSTLAAKHSATTFNLAFYLSNLLKKEMEGESLDRERESKLNIVPYLETIHAATRPGAVAAGPRPKSRMPVLIAAGLTMAAVGIGGWVVLGSKKTPLSTSARAELAGAMVAPPPPKPLVVEPIVASAPSQPPVAPAPAGKIATSTQPQIDEAARKKAFEEAVKRQLNEELMKLQTEYTRQLQQQQARNAPVVQVAAAAPQSAPAVVAAPDEPAPSAALLDEQRLQRLQADPQPTETMAAAAPEQPPAVLTTTAQTPPPAAVAVPLVREGDVIDVTQLDTAPRRTREPRIVYPMVAARQRIEATILATVLISENGEVLEVKILRGEERFGFNDAAIRALRVAQYTAPIKDGKRVKTWLPQLVQFKP